MNILVDARPLTDANSGGVARLGRTLVAAYAETFPDDTLVCVTTGWQRPELPHELRRRQNVRHEHIRVPNKIWSILTVCSIVSLTKTVRSRVKDIHAIFLPNIGFVGALSRDIPTALLVHDLSFIIEPRWFSWKQRIWHRAVRARRLICSATHLLAVSQTTKQDAISLLNIPNERISVIPIGSTFSSDDGRWKTPDARAYRYALALGSSDPRKNTATAESAINILRQDPAFADLRLIIVGRDVKRPTDEELASLYANASVFLYPSWYEGYGLPLHEAASFGTPCIASVTSVLPETAPTGTLFADPAKPHHWAEAIRIAVSTSRIGPINRDENAWNRAVTLLREALRKGSNA